MRKDTIAFIESDIKRVNERRAEIKRGVAAGRIPEGVLKNWDVAFDKIAQDAGLNLTKSGNLPHGKKAVENIDTDALVGLLQRKTAGEIKKDIRTGAQREYGEEPTPEELEDYQDDMSYVYEQLAENYTETYDALNAAFGGTRGKKSYKQLKEAIKQWKDLTEQQKEGMRIDAVNRLFR